MHLNVHTNQVCVFSILRSVEVSFLSLLTVFCEDLRTWPLVKSFHIQGKRLRECQKVAYTLEKKNISSCFVLNSSLLQALSL